MAEVGFDNFLMGFVLPEEGVNQIDGGYNLTPGDPGGETKYGVCKRDFPDVDIKALTLEQAVQLYFREYWLKSGRQKSYCDSMPHPVNLAHFDCCVNVGNWKRTKTGMPYYHGRANMILQRELNVDDDGYIGRITLEALDAADPLRLSAQMIDQRDLYYLSRGAWADKFKAGWLKRTAHLRKYLGLPPRDNDLLLQRFIPLHELPQT